MSSENVFLRCVQRTSFTMLQCNDCDRCCVLYTVVLPSSNTLPLKRGTIVQRFKKQNFNPVDRSSLYKYIWVSVVSYKCRNVEIQYVTTINDIAELRYTSLHKEVTFLMNLHFLKQCVKLMTQ